MSKLNTFRKQQALKAKLVGKPLLHKVVSKEKVDEILYCEFDESRLCSLDYGNSLTYSLDVDPTEIDALLFELGENSAIPGLDMTVSRRRGMSKRKALA